MLHTPPIFILLFSLIFFSSLALNSIPPTMYLTYLSYCLSLPGECLFSKGRDFSLLCLLVYAWYLEGSPMQKRNLVSFSEQMAGREGGEEEYSSAPALRSVRGVYKQRALLCRPVHETTSSPEPHGCVFTQLETLSSAASGMSHAPSWRAMDTTLRKTTASTVSCIKQIANENLVCGTRKSQCSVVT